MMELLGMMPRRIALGGRYSRDFFNRHGDLRHIRRLRFWPLNKVLIEKYGFSERDAKDLTGFLSPILDFVPEKRPSAFQLLQHPWIDSGPSLCEPSLDDAKDSNNGASEKKMKKQENDDKEVVAVELGNIDIGGDPHPSPL